MKLETLTDEEGLWIIGLKAAYIVCMGDGLIGKMLGIEEKNGNFKQEGKRPKWWLHLVIRNQDQTNKYQIYQNPFWILS